MKVKFAVEFEVELDDNNHVEDQIAKLATMIASNIENHSSATFTGDYSYLSEADCTSSEYRTGILYAECL